MIVARHYDEDALVMMLDGRGHESDPHLASCGECAARLREFRLVTDALRDVDTWDHRELDAAPNATTLATIRAFADSMASEDALAERQLPDLLSGPRETWTVRLQSRPELRTAGMTRALMAASDRALDTVPADAVAISAMAVEIAEHLDGDADTIARLRGSACRTNAYALYYTGAFNEADAAVRRAADHYAQVRAAEYDIARLNIVRSLVDRALERISSAAAFAKQSADVFAAFGDDRRTASARLAQVHLLFARGAYRDALSVLRSMERTQRASGDPTTHAQVLANLGFCFWKLGDLDGALKHHEAAAVLFADLGNRTEAIRERWNVASVLATGGKIDEAFRRLARLRDEAAEIGLVHVSVQVSLEIAELHLSRGEFREVELICESAAATYKAAGLAHTTLALTAFAYMDEAVRNRKATPALARHVREYIRRLPEDGQLLFAPPPA